MQEEIKENQQTRLTTPRQATKWLKNAEPLRQAWGQVRKLQSQLGQTGKHQMVFYSTVSAVSEASALKKREQHVRPITSHDFGAVGIDLGCERFLGSGR